MNTFRGAFTCWLYLFVWFQLYSDHDSSGKASSGRRQFASSTEQVRLFKAGTVSSSLKRKISGLLDEIWEEIDEAVDAAGVGIDGGGTGADPGT